jgi:hypothetical protein
MVESHIAILWIGLVFSCFVVKLMCTGSMIDFVRRDLTCYGIELRHVALAGRSSFQHYVCMLFHMFQIMSPCLQEALPRPGIGCSSEMS